MMEARPVRDVAPLLWLLLAAFVARVTGQLLVAFLHVHWLPPMDAWMSGLMPYRYLLPAQLVISLLYAKICLDCTRGRGWFAEAPRKFARRVLVFGYVYFAVMSLRFVARFFPGTAWLGEWIPAVFHLVLASFLILYGRQLCERPRL